MTTPTQTDRLVAEKIYTCSNSETSPIENIELIAQIIADSHEKERAILKECAGYLERLGFNAVGHRQYEGCPEALILAHKISLLSGDTTLEAQTRGVTKTGNEGATPSASNPLPQKEGWCLRFCPTCKHNQMMPEIFTISEETNCKCPVCGSFGLPALPASNPLPQKGGDAEMSEPQKFLTTGAGSNPRATASLVLPPWKAESLTPSASVEPVKTPGQIAFEAWLAPEDFAYLDRCDWNKAPQQSWNRAAQAVASHATRELREEIRQQGIVIALGDCEIAERGVTIATQSAEIERLREALANADRTLRDGGLQSTSIIRSQITEALSPTKD